MVKITKRCQLIVAGLNEETIAHIRGQLTVLNPKYVENDIMGRFNWNTPKHLKFYSEDNGCLQLPRGYLEKLELHLKEAGERFITRDSTLFGRPNRIQFKGSLKPFQEEAVQQLLKYNEGTLAAPTGSGKTVIGIYIITERKLPTIIIVHTRELLYQWIDRLSSFTNLAKEDIGIIGDGKFAPKPITVGLVQTVYKRGPEAAALFGMVLIDECHRCPSRTFTEATLAFSPKYLLGLTATPYRADKLTDIIFLFLGPIRHKVETEALIENQDIVPVKVIVRSTDYTPPESIDPQYDYVKMISDMTKDEKRNLMIASDVAAESKNGLCLVLSDRKEHCDNLANLITNSFGIEALVLTGDKPQKEREKTVALLREGKRNVCVATSQLIGEGFDCDKIRSVFLSVPIKFSGRLIQYIGRAMRISEGKSHGTIYDYLDVNVSILYGSFNRRKSVYKKISI